VYRLGGADLGPTLLGNPDPVRIDLRPGDRFTVVAQFAERHLGRLTAGPPGLRIACAIDPSRAGSGPAAVIEALHPGRFPVTTSTDDCLPCADLEFTAEVMVTAG
jgi:hypothetical protein